jgi:hypothetical protein
MSDVDVLGPRVLNRIIGDIDSTSSLAVAGVYSTVCVKSILGDLVGKSSRRASCYS